MSSAIEALNSGAQLGFYSQDGKLLQVKGTSGLLEFETDPDDDDDKLEKDPTFTIPEENPWLQ